MATHRKTRQQKIQATQKRTDLTDDVMTVTSTSVSSGTVVVNEADEYRYVGQDLKRIALISCICFVILIIATILLSEFSAFTSIRQTLHIPTFTIR